MFSQTFANHTPTTPFIVLSSVESTNNYAMAKLHAGLVDHGFCMLALEQYAGRGQRGKQWVSSPGDNITMSTVLSPERHAHSPLFTFPFLLSASMALACYDFIKDFNVPDISIKWPNDIYIGDRKAAGILIENTYQGANWTGAIVGTGVNINQVNFPTDARKAISLKMVTGTHYDVVRLGRNLFHHLLKRFDTITSDSVLNEYNSLLYQKGKEIKLRKENVVFTARIGTVAASGELSTSGAVEQRFSVGEIEFV